MLLTSTLFILILAQCVHYGDFGYATCPDGFTFKGSKCYKALNQIASWPEAKVYCDILGGDLASPMDAAEQSIITNIIVGNQGSTSENRYWIDGMSVVFEKEWRWMKFDGKSVKFGYTNWYPGQPNYVGERCVAAYGNDNGQWHDHWCDHLLNSICSAMPRDYVVTDG